MGPCLSLFEDSSGRISRHTPVYHYGSSNFYRVQGKFALDPPITTEKRKWKSGGILLDTGMECGNIVSRAYVRDVLHVNEHSLLPLRDRDIACIGIDFNGHPAQMIGVLHLTFKLRGISGCIPVNRLGRQYHERFFVTESLNSPFDIVLGAAFLRDHHVFVAAALPCIVPNTTAEQEAQVRQTREAIRAERDANDAAIRDAERRRQAGGG